jgi:hypothetical protein
MKSVSPAYFEAGLLPQTIYVQNKDGFINKAKGDGLRNLLHAAVSCWCGPSSFYILERSQRRLESTLLKLVFFLIYILIYIYIYHSWLLLYCFLTCIVSPPSLLKDKNLCSFILLRPFDQ